MPAAQDSPARADDSPGAAATQQHPPSLVRSGVWTLVTPLAPAVSAVVLTPFVVHRLGPDRYGMYVLASTVITFLGSFDGGLTASAGRYFSVYAGAGDTRRTTRLLCSLTLALAVAGTLLVLAVHAGAPVLVHVLHAPADVTADGVALVRTLAFSAVGWLLFTVLSGLAAAHGRFAWVSCAYLAGYAVLIAGMVVVLQGGGGLPEVGRVIVAQTLTTLVLAAPAGLRFARAADVGLLPWAEVRQYVGFAAKAQLQGLAYLVNAQLAALWLGATGAVREVGVYTVGANYALQLKYLPLNALRPVTAHLGRGFGERGHAAHEQFQDLQATWARVVGGWTAITVASAWFAVTAWLGTGFERSGVVATLLVAGNLAALGCGVLMAWLNATGHPGVEARYSVVSVLLTVALLAGFTPAWGVVGAAAAVALAQWVSVGYLVTRSRPVLRGDVPFFARSVPWGPAGAAAALTVAVELAARPALPGGGAGLLAAAALSLPGAALFALLTYGRRVCIDTVKDVLARLHPASRPSSPRRGGDPT